MRQRPQNKWEVMDTVRDHLLTQREKSMHNVESEAKTYTLYMDVGMKEGLTGKTLRRYIRYMCARWPKPEHALHMIRLKCAQEWAERFRKGYEYDKADQHGLVVLREIDEEA